MNSNTPKSAIHKHIEALRRFNKWEAANRADQLEDAHSLAAVFELYELFPDDARERPVDVKGIMKMRRALSCLK